MNRNETNTGWRRSLAVQQAMQKVSVCSESPPSSPMANSQTAVQQIVWTRILSEPLASGIQSELFDRRLLLSRFAILQPPPLSRDWKSNC